MTGGLCAPASDGLMRSGARSGNVRAPMAIAASTAIGTTRRKKDTRTSVRLVFEDVGRLRRRRRTVDRFPAEAVAVLDLRADGLRERREIRHREVHAASGEEDLRLPE